MIKQTRIQMGMPIMVAIADLDNTKDLDKVFNYFDKVDRKFSTYKKDSEVCQLSRKEIKEEGLSRELKEVLKLSEQTKKETGGYFDVYHEGKFDPSGLVKGWAIWNAARALKTKGFKNFYIEAGGDIEAVGLNSEKKPWTVGIRNPFNTEEIVKVLKISNRGIATSGEYERGQHIYNPKGLMQTEVVSFTVIGPNIYEADRFATAAFAMGEKGIQFVESKKDLEGYMIDIKGIATYTSGFEQYVK